MSIYFVVYEKLMLVANRFVGSEIPKHDDFDFIDESFENLNSISNIFQEARNFLVLTDSVIICTYLRKRQHKFLWKEPPADILVSKGTNVIPSQSY